MECERRYVAPEGLEVRFRAEDAPTMAGYAAVYDRLSEDLGGWRERIARGAFAAALGEDIRAFWNHDAGEVLGRTKSGTLRLSDDERGLRIEVDPPNTAMARARVETVRRGDVDQMSFGFRALDDEWAVEDGMPVRTLRAVQLFEVSFVTFPAYPETSAAVRSLEAWRERTAPPAPRHELRRRRIVAALY